MPLNQTLKGKEYEEVTFTVDGDRVGQFAEAIGEHSPVFRERQATEAGGFLEQLAPPTFVTVMQIMASGQVVLDQDLGLDYSLIVHGEQEYEWQRMVRVGDRLRAVPRIADIYAKGPNEYVVIESEIRDEVDELVAVARTTLLSRGTAAR